MIRLRHSKSKMLVQTPESNQYKTSRAERDQLMERSAAIVKYKKRVIDARHTDELPTFGTNCSFCRTEYEHLLEVQEKCLSLIELYESRIDRESMFKVE